MDSASGGQPKTTSKNDSLAREKVFAAYQSNFNAKTKPLTDQNTNTQSLTVNNSQSISQAQSAAISNADWQKYHSAWQNYYQKYYNEYYSKAAKSYIETEKLKFVREQADEKQITGGATIPRETSDEVYDQVSLNLRTKVQNLAIQRAKANRRHKRLVPFFASLAVAIFFLFLQYNRLIFAPIIAYVSPGNAKDGGIQELDPIIAQKPGPDSKLIIPKLNVNVPVAFSISNDEATVMNAMNHGVAHFAIPGADALPGQIGNTVITGHSAGDIYSNNQYKFIFSGLERLQNKDLIYINYNSVRYTYSITKKEVVLPSEVNKLAYPTEKPIVTLITCTPLGTAEKRLLVTAEQIGASDGSTGTPQTQHLEVANTNSSQLPQNEPSFFERIWRFFVRN